MGLGPYPAVPLKRARLLAAEAREQVAQGIDPIKSRKQANSEAAQASERTFKHVSMLWYEHNLDKGWSDATAEKCMAYLRKDIWPAIGSMQLDDISRQRLNELMRSIEDRGAKNVAKKVRQWLRAIFSYAIGLGWTNSDPASQLNAVAQKAPEAKHYPFLIDAELGQFLADLRRQERVSPRSRLTYEAIWLGLYLGARPGMVRKAEWDEFDLDKGEWSITPARMKKRRAFQSPLPRQLVERLHALHEVTGRGIYLFPGRGNYGHREGLTMSEATMSNAMKRMGYKGKMTPHGARHSASTMLNEADFNPRWIDAQLSHKEQDAPKIRGEYNHAIYMEQRRDMMQWYADHLDKLEKQAKQASSQLQQAS